MEAALALLCETSTMLLHSAPPLDDQFPPLSQYSEEEILHLHGRNKRKSRIQTFTSVTVPGYSEEEFRQHFRLRRDNFEVNYKLRMIESNHLP